MTHGRAKRVSSHRKNKLRKHSLHFAGAVLVVLLGGVISWMILEQIDKAEPNTASTTPKNTAAAIQRVELAGWQAALPIIPGLAKEEVVVSPEEGSGTTSVPNRYKLATKTSQKKMRQCGIEDSTLLSLRRTKELPSQLVGEFMAGTSKIGDYYYIYRSNVQIITEATCTGDARTELIDEARLLERMVSAIQLK